MPGAPALGSKLNEFNALPLLAVVDRDDGAKAEAVAAIETNKRLLLNFILKSESFALQEYDRVL